MWAPPNVAGAPTFYAWRVLPILHKADEKLFKIFANEFENKIFIKIFLKKYQICWGGGGGGGEKKSATEKQNWQNWYSGEPAEETQWLFKLKLPAAKKFNNYWYTVWILLAECCEVFHTVIQHTLK